MLSSSDQGKGLALPMYVTFQNAIFEVPKCPRAAILSVLINFLLLFLHDLYYRRYGEVTLGGSAMQCILESLIYFFFSRPFPGLVINDRKYL